MKYYRESEANENSSDELEEVNEKLIEEIVEESDEANKELIEEIVEETKITKKTFAIKKHICHICKKSFRDAYELRRHLNRKEPCAPNLVPVIKNDNSKNMCKFCGKTYSSIYSLKRHQKVCVMVMAKNPRLMLNYVLHRDQEIEQLEAKINAIIASRRQDTNSQVLDE